MVLQRPVPAAEAQARQVEPQAPEEVQEMVQVVGRSVQEHLPPLHREKGEGGVVLQRPVPAAEAQELAGGASGTGGSSRDGAGGGAIGAGTGTFASSSPRVGGRSGSSATGSG